MINAYIQSIVSQLTKIKETNINDESKELYSKILDGTISLLQSGEFDNQIDFPGSLNDPETIRAFSYVYVNLIKYLIQTIYENEIFRQKVHGVEDMQRDQTVLGSICEVKESVTQLSDMVMILSKRIDDIDSKMITNEFMNKNKISTDI